MRPRESDATIFLKPFMDADTQGIPLLQEEARKHFDGLGHGKGAKEGEEDFCPFSRRTYEPLLRAATTLLSSSGKYFPDVAKDRMDRTLPPISDTLTITDTWAVYSRTRSENLLVEDLERLKEK